MPGWQGSTRRARLPANWPQLREQVLLRDRGMCQWRLPNGALCLLPGNQVDHCEPGDDDRLANLQLLCREHHNSKSGREGAAARPSLYRRPERHPGLRGG